MTVRLYDYTRSSACYRVRIALNLKGVAYETVPVDLRVGGQRTAAYHDVNPQGLIPTLEIDGNRLTQSLAIIDYLDARFPEPPLLPRDPAARSAALAMALVIAADIHPIQNLRVMHYLRDHFGADDETQFAWNRHWIEAGFAALEAMAGTTPFLSGDAPGLADVFLIPQMANARRFQVEIAAYPKLVGIDATCTVLPAFAAAHPDAVKPD